MPLARLIRRIGRHSRGLARLAGEHQPLLLGGATLMLAVLGLSGCMLTPLLQAPSLLALLAAAVLGLGACASGGSSSSSSGTPATPAGPPPAMKWPQSLDLAQLSGHGVQLVGTAHWGTGWSLSSGLDVGGSATGGDGIDDLLIGTYSVFNSSLIPGSEDHPQGSAYLIFGSKTFGSAATGGVLAIEAKLSSIGRQFVSPVTAHAGYSVALAPDVTGDGKNDILIGSNAGVQPNGNDYSATDIAWAIQGPVTPSTSQSIVPLPSSTTGNPTSPFSAIFNGAAAADHDRLGFSTAVVGLQHDAGKGAQNVLVLGAPLPAAGSAIGPSVDVLFSGNGIGQQGKSIGALGVGTGFVFTGAPNSGTGWSVADAGDINGDGINDLIIGAPTAGIGGEVYVIFGIELPNTNFPTTPAALTGATGFTITNTTSAGAQAGWTVAPAGDVNGDGISDFMVNVPGAGFTGHVGGLAASGNVYVIFGRPLATAWPASIDLSALADGTNGFSVTMPANTSARSLGHGVFNTKSVTSTATTASYSTSVTSTNPSTLQTVTTVVPVSDMVIGVPGAFAANGAVYVLFGNNGSVAANPAPWAAAGTVDLNNAAGLLQGSNKGGFWVQGALLSGSQVGWSVAVGDLNGDGTADLTIGAPYNDPANDIGTVYVLYGLKPGQTYP